MMYSPALMRLENASSEVGFSLNLAIYPSERLESISPLFSVERPTIPTVSYTHLRAHET